VGLQKYSYPVISGCQERSMEIDINKAMAYNQRKAPESFLCQSTLERVNPGTPAGVHWVARRQRSLDDASWSKEGRSWYDPDKRITVDGMLGPQTQRELEHRYGEFSSTLQTRHPLPWFISVDRYDHARDPDDLSYRQSAPEWEAFTSHGRWYDAMFRLVSGWEARRGTFSRVPKDWISLDEFSIGIAHFWADTAPKLLAGFVASLPDLSAEAWGEDTARKMRDEDWIRDQIRVLTGKRPHQARYNWLCSGWWYAARREDAMAWQATEWLRKYGRSAKRTIKHFDWTDHLSEPDGGRILAAVIRMANSGGARRMIRAGQSIEGEDASPMRVLEAAYKAPKKRDGQRFGYAKPERWQKIIDWPGFAGPAPTSFTVPIP
jgi:hypothetical protein